MFIAFLQSRGCNVAIRFKFYMLGGRSTMMDGVLTYFGFNCNITWIYRAFRGFPRRDCAVDI